ncbi:MAG: hypothetical protein ACLFV8_07450, partial [Alphaproteobacteria bacterium]
TGEAQSRPQPPAAEEAAGDGPARVQTCAEEGGGEGIFVLGWGMPIPVPNWMAARAPDRPPPQAAPKDTAPKDDGEAAKAIKRAGMFHAPPLPPVLPSAAFWGVEGAGLRPGTPGKGDGDGSRRGNS